MAAAEPGAGRDRQTRAELVNEVRLVGRLGRGAAERVLPSGDVLVAFRVVLDRPRDVRGRPGGRTVVVDAVDCSAWRAPVRRAVLATTEGEVVEVRGALRRRFWRAGAGAASRTEVEVESLRRVRLA